MYRFFRDLRIRPGLVTWSAIIFLLFGVLHAKGQEHDLYFNNFKVKDGLPDNSVISVTQDASGYIWAVTAYGLARYDGVNFKAFKHESSKGSISSNASLFDVQADRKGRIWVASQDLELYHPENETFQKISTGIWSIRAIYFDQQNRLYLGGLGCLKYFEPGDLQHVKTANLAIDKSTQVNAIYEDSEHNIWAGTTKGLFKTNTVGHKPVSFQKITAADQLESNDITAIVQDKNQDLWLGTRTAGLYRYNLKSNSFEQFKSKTADNGPIGDHIRKIIVAKDGTLWIGTQEGLSILNVDKRAFLNFQHDPANQHSLSHNSIHSIFQDRAGSIWIGTYFGGLNVVHLDGTPFTVFQNEAYKNSLSSNIISAIKEDTHHNLWIGTEAGGLNFWNKQTGRFTVFKNDIDNKNSLSSNLVKSIAIDREGDVYIGTANGGLNIYHPSTGKFENYWYSRQKMPPGVSGDDVKSLLITQKGEVLVGTGTGVKVFSKTQHSFITPDTTAKYWVTTLFEDKDRIVWVGTASGLYQITESGHLKRMDFFDSSKKHSPFNFEVNCLQEDKSGRLWAGTYHQGLVLLDRTKHTYQVFTVREGLSGNNVLGILADAHNNLWLSTDNGLSKFDISHSRFQNLTVDDGLPDNQFNKGSYYKQGDNIFYFGTYNGLISFNPDKIAQNKVPPRVVFSYIKLFNQPLKIDQQHQLLKGDVNYARQLTFKYNQDMFTVGFAALNFIKSPKNRYAYRLTGFDRDWNYVDQPAATYTNLAAGDYQLLVKAANNDGVWSEQPEILNIHILPAPWKTWWAYLIYLTITVIILIYIRRFLRARIKLRDDLFRERIEAEQEKRNHEQQLEFFTNVSHEIRTPLTLILGPIERLATIEIENKNAQQYINSIKNNASRLYKLVTELLDFRKAGADQLKLYLTEEDLIKFLKEVFYAFQSAAEIKDINFQFNAEAASLMVYFDRDQLEKVFDNLFINALKFTPKGGSIRVSVHEDRAANQVKIVVENNGEGISEGDLGHIFKNFYQAGRSGGTGIGLALSKRLVELHNGSISVQSKAAIDGKDGFTTFTVILKLGTEHVTDEQIILQDASPRSDIIYMDSEPDEELAPEYDSLPSDNGSRSILLVEDNDEVREFIKQTLENDYKVIEAENGQEGLNYAIRLIPDLVISDVMMPLMDGLELCSKLKSDIRTSHIPVILLTAKSAPVHHILGLQRGADAYITKPFSPQVLHLNIHNMLRLISAQQRKYSEHLDLEPLPMHHHAASEDEKLLNKLQEIIQNNIDNPDLDLTALTRELGMSKSVLYKKFSALTNQSLNSFIKTERLKKAVKLFKEGETSVIAVAVKVGFNDVKYFSKEFKKLYNVTPNEYLNGGID